MTRPVAKLRYYYNYHGAAGAIEGEVKKRLGPEATAHIEPRK